MRRYKRHNKFRNLVRNVSDVYVNTFVGSILPVIIFSIVGSIVGYYVGREDSVEIELYKIVLCGLGFSYVAFFFGETFWLLTKLKNESRRKVCRTTFKERGIYTIGLLISYAWLTAIAGLATVIRIDGILAWVLLILLIVVLIIVSVSAILYIGKVKEERKHGII